MKTKKYILIISIITLGFFLRIYNIENAPPGVYPDEAVNGIDAMTAIETGNMQWFYPANNGREGMFMNLISFCFQIIGVSVLSLKLPSIIFGTLTILGTYLLTKELFKKEFPALISSFLVATSFWAINFSRISFRANTLPTILTFSFYFFWRGLRTKKWWDFAASGLVFGLGLHTYISFRIAPAILLALLFVLLISRQKFFQKYWKMGIVFIVFTFLSASPMLYTFYTHPEYVVSRSSSISILNPEVNQGDLLGTFLKSFGLSLAKYNFWGDQNWRHNYPPYPLLDPLTGIAFAFGLIYSLLKIFPLLYQRLWKKERSEKLEIYSFLIIWFFVMLAPEFMTAEGNPHALRAIGTLPVVFIFSALTFQFLKKKIIQYSPIFRTGAYLILSLMMIIIGSFNALKYHVAWANETEAARAFDHNLMELSNYLKNSPTSQEKFVVIEVMQRIPVQLFNWKRANISYFYPAEIEQIEPTNPENMEIILTDYNEEIVNNLQSRFPELNLVEIKDRYGLSFYILK